MSRRSCDRSLSAPARLHRHTATLHTETQLTMLPRIQVTIRTHSSLGSTTSLSLTKICLQRCDISRAALATAALLIASNLPDTLQHSSVKVNLNVTGFSTSRTARHVLRASRRIPRVLNAWQQCCIFHRLHRRLRLLTCLL